jgi:hypothetical protein
MRARLRESLAALPVVTILLTAVIAVTCTTVILLTGTDSLGAGVSVALAPRPPAPPLLGGIMMMTDGPLTGTARGIQVAVLMLLLGGVPAALVGSLAAGYRRLRSGPRSDAFLNMYWLGLMFQLSSAGATSLVVAGILVSFGLEPMMFPDAWPLVGVPAAALGCCAWGVRCWFTLQRGERQGMTRLGLAR